MAVGWGIIYSFRDAKGETSTTELRLPAATTQVRVVDFAGQMATLINSLTTGVITRVGVVLDVSLPGGLRTTPDLDSDVEEGGRFQFGTSGGFYTSMRIPTFDETLVSAGSDAIDTEDSDVAAFVNAMVAGLTTSGAVTQPSDTRGEDVVSLVSAKEQFLGSR